MEDNSVKIVCFDGPTIKPGPRLEPELNFYGVSSVLALLNDESLAAIREIIREEISAALKK